MDRRDFIKVSGITGGGFLMNLSLPINHLLGNNLGTLAPNALLKIEKSGVVTFQLTKLEMGQGISTGITMILADELGVAWKHIKTEQADYDRSKFNGAIQGGTGGSWAIRDLWNPLRKAAATARTMLIQAAANQWKVNPKDCYTQNSQVIHRLTNKKIDFAKLTTSAAKLPIPQKPTLKDPKDYQYIGKPIKNREVRNIAQGTQTYTMDLNIPGTLYASIERCPVNQGRLLSYDASEALKVKGVVKIVALKGIKNIKDGIAVIATNTWATFKARKALKIKWSQSPFSNQNLSGFKNALAQLHNVPGKPGFTKGNYNKAFQSADTVLEAVYESPYQCHATMEPPVAVAQFKNNRCEVWSGVQSGGKVINQINQALGIPKSAIKVHILPAGGSFGRKFDPDFAVEAATVSKLGGGQPIKLVWSREDDMQHDRYHAFEHIKYRVAIKDNKIAGWDSKVINVFGQGGSLDDYHYVYHFPTIKTHGVAASAWKTLPTGAWRSVSNHRSALGYESFLDEIAHKTNKDPLDFRLELLQKPVSLLGTGKRSKNIQRYRQLLRDRFKIVLEKIRSKADWGKKMPKGYGQGLAIFQFGRTVCAHVVEVAVLEGNLTINKITSVMHVGRVINPHIVKGQVEGSIIWALSAALYGGVDFEKGVPKTTNFDNYKVLRMDEIPEMDIHLVESNDDPVGAGEPATPPLAPALLNAIFAATGKRIRKIPVLKEDLV